MPGPHVPGRLLLTAGQSFDLDDASDADEPAEARDEDTMVVDAGVVWLCLTRVEEATQVARPKRNAKRDFFEAEPASENNKKLRRAETL